MAQHQVATLETGTEASNQAAEHYYLVTDSIPEVDPNWQLKIPAVTRIFDPRVAA